MFFLIMCIICCQLFHPSTGPSVRISNCGLGGQEEPPTTTRSLRNGQLKKPQMGKNNNFRRSGTYTTVWPWQIQDPRELKILAPTKRTPRIYYNLSEVRCDYMRMVCLKAYKTGAICGRTFYYQYMSFPTYCQMEWMNCIYGYEALFTIAYVGYCSPVNMDKDLYVDMTYDQMSNNSKLKTMYVDSGDITNYKGYATMESTTEGKNVKRYTLTDKMGKPVIDTNGQYVTYTVIVTEAYINVTNQEGKLVTDDYGDFITELLTTTPSTTKKS